MQTLPPTIEGRYKDTSGNNLTISGQSVGRINTHTIQDSINGGIISDTNNLIKKSIGHVRDFQVKRNRSGNDIVTVQCQGFESFLKDTLNINYPDKFDYWALNYAGREFTSTSPDGIDFPPTYDQWPIEDSFKSLLLRGFIDPTFFTKRKQHLSVSGTLVSGSFLIERSVPALTLSRARNYGNPGLAVVTFREIDGDVVPVLPDDEYKLKSNFGDNLFDYINKVIEPYGWDWGSKSYYDGGFYLRTRNNPTDVIGSKSITFTGAWSQSTDLDAVSGTYQVTSDASDFAQFSFFGNRVDAVLALSNILAGTQARVAGGDSTTVFTTQEVEGDSFSAGNRLILDLPTGRESTKIVSISSNELTVDPPLSITPVSGTLIRTAVASYNIVRGTQYVEEDTIVSGFLPSYHPMGYSDNVYTYQSRFQLFGKRINFIVSGTRRLFYQGFDRETAQNPTIFNLANDLTRDNHIIRITKLDNAQAGATNQVRLNALFIYDENRVFPVTTFYTGETLASGTIIDLQTSNLGSNIRNDVTVVGRRVGAIVPGGFGNVPQNPNNPIFNHFVSRAVDINSIVNPNAKNFIGRPLQTLLIDPDISAQDRADFWAIQFMNRFRFPGVDAQFKALANPRIEEGDAIYVEDTKKDSINNDNVVFVESKKTDVANGISIDTFTTTSFPPWESLVPKTPVDISDFGNVPIQNIEFIPNTSNVVGEQYDPYDSDSNGTIIQIKYDLVISGFVRIEVFSVNGTKVADLLNIDGKEGLKGWLQDTAGKNKLVTWDGVDQFGEWNDSRIEKEAGLETKGENWFVAEDALVATDLNGGAVGKFYIKFTVVDDAGNKLEIDSSIDNSAPNDFIYTKRGLAVNLLTVMTPSFTPGTPSSGFVGGFADTANDGNGLKFNIATTRPAQLRFSAYRKAFGFILSFKDGNQKTHYQVPFGTPVQEYPLIKRQEFIKYTSLNQFIAPKDLFVYDDFRGLFKPQNPDTFSLLGNDRLEVYIGWYFVFKVIATDKSGRSSVDTFVHFWEGPTDRTTSTPPDFLQLQIPAESRVILGEALGVLYTNLVRTIT